jgi:hypothetical protein
MVKGYKQKALSYSIALRALRETPSFLSNAFSASESFGLGEPFDLLLEAFFVAFDLARIGVSSSASRLAR